jgi:hypothetical protein
VDRNIVYPGSIPLDTDILYPNRHAMVGIAALTAATLGSNVVVDGLACNPTSPASLTVTVGPGSITQLSPLDATAYGSLAADLTDQIMKTGIQPGDLVLTSAAADGTRAVLWLSGGQAQTTYTVTVTIMTAAGRTLARSIALPVVALAAVPVPVNALTTSAGQALTDPTGTPLTL